MNKFKVGDFVRKKDETKESVFNGTLQIVTVVKNKNNWDLALGGDGYDYLYECENGVHMLLWNIPEEKLEKVEEKLKSEDQLKDLVNQINIIESKKKELEELNKQYNKNLENFKKCLLDEWCNK